MSEKFFASIYAPHKQSALRTAQREYNELMRYLQRRLFPGTRSLTQEQTERLNALGDTLSQIMSAQKCSALSALDFYENHSE
jgi:hypothetical protein